MEQYVPGRGEIIRFEINPDETVTKEKKTALVISPKSYNEKTGLVIICPVKTKVKGYPFEVIIPEDLKVSGIILSDQVKSINWKIRKADYVCKLPEEKLSEVLSKIHTLI